MTRFSWHGRQTKSRLGWSPLLSNPGRRRASGRSVELRKPPRKTGSVELSLPFLLLLHTQRRHRADAGGAAGGDPGSEQRSDGEGEGSDSKGNWVEGANFVE